MKAIEADVEHTLNLLSALDHPPNENPESIARQLEKWSFRRGDVMMRLDVQPDNRYIEIIWWLPLSQWLTPDGMGILIEACDAVIKEYGEDVREWGIGGQFDAPGETKEEMRERSTKAAEIHKRWLPDVEIGPDENSNYARATSTVSKVLEQAEKFLNGHS